MSREAIERLVESTESNARLLAQLRAAQTPEEKAAIASSHGFDVSAAEWKALRDMKEPPAAGEVSDQELEGVSGGIIEFLEWMGGAMYQRARRFFD